MQRDELRRIMKEQFSQSLADSGVAVSAIPDDQLEAIMNAQADSVFAIMAAIGEEDDSPPRAATPMPLAPSTSDDDEEVILWTGKPYMTIGVRYELTNHRIRTVRGVLGRSVEEIELVRVRDTKATQHTGERLINVGDISVISNDASTPEFVLNNVKDPFEIREMIRKAALEEKERRGLHYREEM